MTSTTFAGMELLVISVWKKLEAFDQWLFELINSHWTNPVFDAVMPFLRQPIHWAPLYLFVLAFAAINFKTKGLWWIVLFLCTVALTDMTGTYIFKNNFQRPRPCSDPDFFSHVRLLLKQCSGSSSFISNHAANHFGMAVFFFVTFRHLFRRWCWLAIGWAAAISYAQVYVGVHYPLDVLGGGLTGTAWGLFTATLFNKRFGFIIFGNQPVS